MRRELHDGATRVVQIGAGLDPLTFRLHREFPETTFTELDHPATRRAKLRVIDALGGAEGNLELHPIDLADPDTPGNVGDASQRTVIIIALHDLCRHPSSVGVCHSP